MPHERPRQQPLTGPGRRALGRAHGRAPRRGLAMALVGVLAALQPSQIATAQYGQPRISVAPMITAAPASQVLLPIEVGPPEALPNNSFVRVRGLPPTVSLSDGHAIGPGSWAIPLFALPTLKATIPAGIAERGNVVISLVAVDGTLLAEARTVLVIGSAAEKLFAESRAEEGARARATGTGRQSGAGACAHPRGQGARGAPSGPRRGAPERRQRCRCPRLLRTSGGRRAGNGCHSACSNLRPCGASPRTGARHCCGCRNRSPVVRARARAGRARSRGAPGAARRQLTLAAGAACRRERDR